MHRASPFFTPHVHCFPSPQRVTRYPLHDEKDEAQRLAAVRVAGTAGALAAGPGLLLRRQPIPVVTQPRGPALTLSLLDTR